MGYRYYVGYFSKDKMGEILKEADRLKGLIGTPKHIKGSYVIDILLQTLH